MVGAVGKPRWIDAKKVIREQRSIGRGVSFHQSIPDHRFQRDEEVHFQITHPTSVARPTSSRLAVLTRVPVRRGRRLYADAMSAEVVLPAGDDLQTTIDWFADIAGFKMTMITPADEPRISVLSGHGLTIRLDSSASGPSGSIRIPDTDPRTVTAPNGTTVQFVTTQDRLELPKNAAEFVHSRFADADFGAGRAGMQYRDLIPNRQGGRFIASHIAIPEGGPVPDYVHHHHVRFQMIFCHTGWADLVYEDQGPPFRMQAGDCVLQPPHIRHRVLATSDRFEVVEIGCPAVHDTLRDHELELPTAVVDVDRDFGGQRFVWHRAEGAISNPRPDGSTFTNFGIDAATDGLATVGIVDQPSSLDSAFELLFWFVRSGNALLDGEPVTARDAITFAPGHSHALTEISPDFQVLQVQL